MQRGAHPAVHTGHPRFAHRGGDHGGVSDARTHSRPASFQGTSRCGLGVIASFYVGNVILLILNLPLIGIWIKILKIPYGILFGIIMAFIVVGAYSVNNTVFDVMIMTLFGLIGYLLRKLDFPLAPVVLTLILGPMMEQALRQSLEMSRGSFGIFLESPIAVVLLVLTALILIAPVFKVFRRGKHFIAGDEEGV